MKYSLIIFACCLDVAAAFAGSSTPLPPWTTVSRAVSTWAASPADRAALAGYIVGVSDEYVWEYKTDVKRLVGGKVLTGDEVIICPNTRPRADVIEAWLATPMVLTQYGNASLLAAVDAYMADWLKSSCHDRKP